MKQHFAAAIALAVLIAPAAFAAGDNQGSTSGQTQTIRPDQMRASQLIGTSVYDRDNQRVGSIQDLVLNKTGRVDLVVVDVGSYLGVGGKNVALHMSDLKTDNNRLTLNETKGQLQQSQNYQLEDTNTGAGEGPSPVTGGRVGTGAGSTGTTRTP